MAPKLISKKLERLERLLSLGILIGGLGCSAAPGPSPSSPTKANPKAEEQRHSAQAGPGATGAPVEELGTGPGWLGAELSLTERTEPGVQVLAVVPQSPAAKAGVLAHDVILSVDGAAVKEPQEVVTRISAKPSGSQIALAILRQGKTRLLKATLAPRPDPDQLLAQTFLGTQAPEFSELISIQGSAPTTIQSLSGRVVIVEFWADFCQVCRLMVPVMETWKARWAGQGVELLSITTDPIDVAIRSSAQQKIGYPVAVDTHGKTTVAYKAYALPALYVIDQRGVIRELMTGFEPDKLIHIEKLVDQLLRQHR